MINKLKKIWEDKGFEIVIGVCIVILLVGCLWNKISGTKGTHSKYIHIPRKVSGYGNIQKPHYIKSEKNKSKGEEECRRVLQSIFRVPFTSQRPDFLRNPVTGGNFNLELDCYNAELGLAVEYNGQQHYKYIPYFHRNKDHFMTQKYRDDMKRRICREQNIVLIEVPYTVSIKDIANFIINECKKYGYLQT
jgi:hypothetical protein